ncbi:CHAP domain-containing protein [Flavobacterium sp. Sd200]|uniref:peptidoglycan-binding protein n=1 Tax=Flavobacterium sp. Sd200 TaxID=2692211 RepID=UPI00136C3169|nr:peptidoglycan-binding protein [Flavobacterium sp. Sd200]MXN89958.1 CHAP domain-containing protein [Flavobacterium sp. Sd200]
MSRSKVLETAKAELGTIESPANSNKTKYGVWYNLNGVKWCAIFVSWVFDKAGVPLGNIQSAKGIHHCQSAHNYYKSKGMITTAPEPGDIVIYDWEGNGHADHIGIFIRWKNTAKTILEAYEGNTSQGNNSDGGRVMLRERSRNIVKSFINPGVYTDASIEKPADVLRNGDRGSAVTVLQKYLFDLDYAIEVDGWFGGQTEGFLKEFQKENNMPETGEADTVTIGALQEAVNDKKMALAELNSGSYLKKGSNGFLVIEVQKALNAKDPQLKLPVTGTFADKTHNAVKAFQLKNGLDDDGVVGPLTFAKLGIG